MQSREIELVPEEGGGRSLRNRLDIPAPEKATAGSRALAFIGRIVVSLVGLFMLAIGIACLAGANSLWKSGDVMWSIPLVLFGFWIGAVGGYTFGTAFTSKM